MVQPTIYSSHTQPISTRTGAPEWVSLRGEDVFMYSCKQKDPRCTLFAFGVQFEKVERPIHDRLSILYCKERDIRGTKLHTSKPFFAHQERSFHLFMQEVSERVDDDLLQDAFGRVDPWYAFSVVYYEAHWTYVFVSDHCAADGARCARLFQTYLVDPESEPYVLHEILPPVGEKGGVVCVPHTFMHMLELRSTLPKTLSFANRYRISRPSRQVMKTRDQLSVRTVSVLLGMFCHTIFAQRNEEDFTVAVPMAFKPVHGGAKMNNQYGIITFTVKRADSVDALILQVHASLKRFAYTMYGSYELFQIADQPKLAELRNSGAESSIDVVFSYIPLCKKNCTMGGYPIRSLTQLHTVSSTYNITHHMGDVFISTVQTKCPDLWFE